MPWSMHHGQCHVPELAAPAAAADADEADADDPDPTPEVAEGGN